MDKERVIIQEQYPKIEESDVENILKTCEIGDKKQIDSLHGVLFLELIDNGHAIFKPKEKEALVQEIGTGYKRERAAFLLDSFLKTNLVPETVIRDIEGQGLGSMQRFIPNAKIAEEYSQSLLRVLEGFTSQIMRLHILDFILAERDRHTGNWMIDKDRKVWAIDHGNSFGKDPIRLNHEVIDHEFEAELVDKIKELAEGGLQDDLRKKFIDEDLLTEEEVEACIMRIKILNKAFIGNVIEEDGFRGVDKIIDEM